MRCLHPALDAVLFAGVDFLLDQRQEVTGIVQIFLGGIGGKGQVMLADGRQVELTQIGFKQRILFHHLTPSSWL